MNMNYHALYKRKHAGVSKLCIIDQTLDIIIFGSFWFCMVKSIKRITSINIFTFTFTFQVEKQRLRFLINDELIYSTKVKSSRKYRPILTNTVGNTTYVLDTKKGQVRELLCVLKMFALSAKLAANSFACIKADRHMHGEDMTPWTVFHDLP